MKGARWLLYLVVLVLVGCGGGGGGGPSIQQDTETADAVDTVEGDSVDPADSLPGVDTPIPDGCEPSCEDKECGDNGCGGSCWTSNEPECGGSGTCVDGKCVPCEPDCEGKDCGDDGCGDICGECEDGESCEDGLCVAPTTCPELPCEEGLHCDEETGDCVACLEDLDCPGFHKCIEHECIAPDPCESSKDCAGDQICDKEKGICVDCVTDADCPEGYRCLATQVCQEILFCDSDKDCTAYDKVCDKDLGECVDCLSDADCDASEFCHDQICFNDACDQDAEWPQCDNGMVVTCNENGSLLTVLEVCGEGQFCGDGECQEWICVPESIGCEGTLAFECNGDGSGYDWSEDCAELDDHACVEGECMEVLCEPGETLCITPGSQVVCGDDGMEFEVEQCPLGTYCEEETSACTSWVCAPDETWCDGTEILVCDEWGSDWSVQEDCEDQDLPCINGQCIECAPQCEGKTCGDDGCGSTCGECEGEQVCVEGQCFEPVCDDGCTGQTGPAVLCGLELCQPGYAHSAAVSAPLGDNIDQSWGVLDRYGSQQNDLAPQAGPSYLVISSGKLYATTHDHQLQPNAAGNDPLEQAVSNDVVQAQLQLTAPGDVTGFCLDYVILSAEFTQNQQYNDKFYILLTIGDETQAINYMPCGNPNKYTSFNQNGAAMCYTAIWAGINENCQEPPTNLFGTGYGCSSGWLRTCWPIQPAQDFNLTLHVQDTHDARYDTAVVIDHFEWLHGDFQPGTDSIFNPN